MKHILVYGDSLTWGSNPETWKRYNYEDRWTTVMQRELGSEYEVIPEALSGRTTCWHLPHLPYRNGAESLPMILETHRPLDLVIVMLGINDLNSCLNKTAEDSAAGLFAVLRRIYFSASSPDEKCPGILVIAPPVMRKLSDFMDIMYSRGREESLKLPALYKTVCERFGCLFIDSNEFARAGDTDGLHFDVDTNHMFGKRIAKEVMKIFAV